MRADPRAVDDEVRGTGEVPFVDLAAAHREIAEEVEAGWAGVLQRMRFILGPELEAFETELSAFTGAGAAVGVGNGTDAIEFALRAIGVGPGDEVIVPANSFIATAVAVARTGATPVFVDVDEATYLIDPASVRAALSPSTRAVVPVHLYGQIAPVERLDLPPGVAVVEDAAQAQGATRSGRGIGAHGIAAATSFYPGKNLGAYGDAGAVLTNSPEVERAVRALRDTGSRRKYEHEVLGFNSRLDEMQAVVLRAKLRRLAAWDRARRKAAERYAELLAGLDEVRLPTVLEGNEHVWHLYVVRVPRRAQVIDALTAAGIGTGVHYPTPIHLQGAFEDAGYARGDLPVTERVSEEILSLPMHPHLEWEQQRFVAAELERAVRRAG